MIIETEKKRERDSKRELKSFSSIATFLLFKVFKLHSIKTSWQKNISSVSKMSSSSPRPPEHRALKQVAVSMSAQRPSLFRSFVARQPLSLRTFLIKAVTMTSTLSPGLHLPLHVDASALTIGVDDIKDGTTTMTPTTPTFCVDTQVLRDNLEKERYKRKHCIKQIHELQEKLLETQQQLAVAVSVDKKKELMIEQLDKTLAQLVEGWKKQEAERQSVVDGLKTDKADAEQRLSKARVDYEKLVADQSDLADRLQRQMQLLKRKDAERQAEIDRWRKEASRLEGALEEERKATSAAAKERERVNAERKEESVWREKQRLAASEERRLLESKMLVQRKEFESHTAALQKDFEASAEALRAQLSGQKKVNAQTTEELSTAQKEATQLEVELDAARRERESLKVELNIATAKHEAASKRIKSEARLEAEQLMEQRLQEVVLHWTSKERKTAEDHAAKLEQMAARSAAEQNAAREASETEAARAKKRHQELVESLEAKLCESHRFIGKLLEEKKEMETNRDDVVAKVRSMMRSHCSETLRLLDEGAEVPGTASRFSGIAIDGDGVVGGARPRYELYDALPGTGAAPRPASGSVDSGVSRSDEGATSDDGVEGLPFDARTRSSPASKAPKMPSEAASNGIDTTLNAAPEDNDELMNLFRGIIQRTKTTPPTTTTPKATTTTSATKKENSANLLLCQDKIKRFLTLMNANQDGSE